VDSVTASIGRKWAFAALVLAAVALPAVGLRFWRLSWGLDQNLCFPDEFFRWHPYVRQFVPLTAASFTLPAETVSHSLLSRLVYPTLYGYAMLVAIWGYSFTLAASQVARFSYEQQREIARWVATYTRAPEHPHRSISVGVPAYLAAWDQLYVPLEAEGLRCEAMDENPSPASNVVVVPERLITGAAGRRPRVGRGRPTPPRSSFVPPGFHEVATWRSWFLQRDLYAWLDPALPTEHPGARGFSVFVRDSEPREH